ncbi:hypothetical protein IAQ61_010899 [Plenodomus lingam]|uniref:uncharacterized protein n=1 Tax=Leptosphaeria maculans TaxID=5022 RepID=UPI00332CA706|nr:hypothetical protein IAQ61_010899 [Plenodomus lingam]
MSTRYSSGLQQTETDKILPCSKSTVVPMYERAAGQALPYSGTMVGDEARAIAGTRQAPEPMDA